MSLENTSTDVLTLLTGPCAMDLPYQLWPLPIHERIAVHPQYASPLFNGQIPPETRDTLFQWILTEYTKTDPASEYSQALCRPGYTGARAVNIAFLVTCLPIYLEAYHLPAANKEHIFWHSPATAIPRRGGQLGLRTRKGMYWLEQSFPEMCESGVLPARMEHLGLTLRAGDWWWCEQNYPLFLNPHRHGDLDAMNADIEAEERGETIKWMESGWGSAFRALRALKELEIEFETTMDRREEMRRIVNRALTWRFPMVESGALSTENMGMQFSQWQGEEHLHCVFTVKWKLVGGS
ncbi:hypothetical protein C8R43DRAFT_1127937 [Mycena crocata]|nr:hypothetical protein C8R43DRAFT_1127937 [Mycena crocata]